MAILVFGTVVTIGTLQYTGNVAGVRIVSALGPAVGSASVRLPRDLRVDAAPGDAVQITLAGESAAAVTTFTGTVVAVRRELDRTVVTCADAAAAVAATRPGSTSEQQNAQAVVTAILRAAGVTASGIDLTLELPGYIADQARTGWEHLCTLASWAGAIATSTADGGISVRPFPEPPADLALRYGREVAELRVSSIAAQVGRTLIGNGPAGNGSDPAALLQTVATLPDAPAGPGPRALRLPAPALRNPDAVSSAGTALAERNGGGRISGRCWLVPQLRAGVSIEVADAPQPDGLGPWLLTRVVHQVGPGPVGSTSFDGTALAASPGGLDALLGAVGGLL